MQQMLRILTARDVKALLTGCEERVVSIVRDAYLAHQAGRTRVPHSCFLYVNKESKSRIIALPALLESDPPVVGMKWIASFPENVPRGLDRATGVIVLNSPTTGYPEVLAEGSLISSWRTAASAALASGVLHGGTVRRVGVIGCGQIAFTYCHFMAALFPALAELRFADLSLERAASLARRVTEDVGSKISCRVHTTKEVCASCPVILFATTAGAAHFSDPDLLQPSSTLLHVSLRDLSPEVIIASDNLVDDVDHVTREQTSIHLAAQVHGSLGFIRGTLGEVLAGAKPPRAAGDRSLVFSPFGLGILDLAVAQFTRERAEEQGIGIQVSDFDPMPWNRS
jgi:2,3-diaminopropionate biosynthesis protein SbnB